MEIKKIDQVARFGRQAKRKRRRLPSITVPESGLQKQMDDTLDAYHVKFLRLEKPFWKWFRQNAPPYIFYPFCERFLGMTDNVCLLPISEKYNLCMAPELKTERGKLNPDQRKWQRDIAVQVLRSTEENEAAVVDFVKMAKQLREVLND